MSRHGCDLLFEWLDEVFDVGETVGYCCDRWVWNVLILIVWIWNWIVRWLSKVFVFDDFFFVDVLFVDDSFDKVMLFLGVGSGLFEVLLLLQKKGICVDGCVVWSVVVLLVVNLVKLNIVVFLVVELN